MNSYANLLIIDPESQIEQMQIEELGKNLGALRNNVTPTSSKSILGKNYLESREININAIQLDESVQTVRSQEFNPSPKVIEDIAFLTFPKQRIQQKPLVDAKAEENEE